jgi:hypothetical protein
MPYGNYFRASLCLVCIVAAGCGADHTTAPADDETIRAAVNGVPFPLSSGANSDVQIGLSWVDNSPNETGFEIHRAKTASGTFSLRATVGADITYYADDGLTPLTEFCYKVRTVRARGKQVAYSDFSNTACSTTFGPPPAPARIDAVPGEWGAVAITWDAASTATGYRLQRSPNGVDSWELIATTGATSYTDGGRALEQRVCYRVEAYNAYGANTSGADCTALPNAPSTLVATGAPVGIDLTWSDNSLVEDGYEVQRAEGNYVFSTIATLPSNATTYRDASPVVNTVYWYRVRARKDGGFSSFSNWDDALKATTAPSAPSNTFALPGSSNLVRISWQDNSDNEEGFRVERSLDGGSSWVTAAIAGLGQQTVEDYDRAAEVQVCYRVVAFNGAGSSSSAVDCTTPPSAPTGLLATALGSNTIELTWGHESSVTDGYEVQRLECYYGYYYYCYPYTIATLDREARTWQDTGLSAGFWYTYQVVAFTIEIDAGGVQQKGYSTSSEQVSAWTPSP